MPKNSIKGHMEDSAFVKGIYHQGSHPEAEDVHNRLHMIKTGNCART